MNDYLTYLEKYNHNIKNIFAKNLKHNLKIIYNFSQERKEKVYLVGGIVRDIFLGRNSKDIDIILKEDSQEFAVALLPKLKVAKHRYTEKFLTYNIFTHSGVGIDIGSFNPETSISVRNLSSTLPIEIENDYSRRDFTINAMYLSFDEKAEFYDPLNAIEDLKNKTIKIISEKGFEEDPKRIFRAIRLIARYNFSLEEKTEQLLKDAVNKNLLSEITSTRLRNDLYTLFNEKNLKAILRKFKEYNIFKFLNIPNPSDETLEEILKIIRTYYFLHAKEELKISRGNFIIFYLLKNLSYEDKINAIKFLEFSETTLNNFIFTDREKTELMEKLSLCTKKSEIYKLLSTVSNFKLLYLFFTEKENKNKIKKYLFKLITKEPIITDNDLIEIGLSDEISISENLKNCFAIQLDIENPSKEQIIAQFIEEIKNRN